MFRALNASHVRLASLRSLPRFAPQIRTVITNRDYKPDPYPQTEEARIAAAKKYGMHPDSYKPIPDDGEGYGDYPDIPLVSWESRDPYYPYDDPVHRRNFGEPVHLEYELYDAYHLDETKKPKVPYNVQLAYFLGFMSINMAFYFFFENYRSYNAILEKQLPEAGGVHYSFEPLKSGK